MLCATCGPLEDRKGNFREHSMALGALRGAELDILRVRMEKDQESRSLQHISSHLYSISSAI